MPKTPTTPTKRKGVPSASPSKQPRREKEPVQDRSQWRSSRIHPDTTIYKSAAMHNYRLSEDEPKGLSRETSSAVKKIGGTDRMTVMYLYNEREIELRAWEKHGGPEGFERMLTKRRAIWDKLCKTDPKKAMRVFPQPRSYISANDQVYLMCSPSKNAPDFETSTPALLQMKYEMTNAGALWLWDILNDRFIQHADFDVIMTGPKREEVITSVRSTLLEYPRRPTSPPPQTSSFNNLQEVLRRAPVDRGQSRALGLDINEISGPTGWRTVNWDSSYQDEVYSALIQVIREHSVGGWRRARWLVYDKYLECNIGHIDFEDGCWEDSADFWLDAEDRGLPPSPYRPSQLRKRYYSLLSRAHSGY